MSTGRLVARHHLGLKKLCRCTSCLLESTSGKLISHHEWALHSARKNAALFGHSAPAEQRHPLNSGSTPSSPSQTPHAPLAAPPSPPQTPHASMSTMSDDIPHPTAVYIKPNHILDKNIIILDTIQRRIRETLNSVPPCRVDARSQSTTPSMPMPSFLEPAESAICSFEQEILAITLKNEVLMARKESVIEDLTELKSRVTRWRIVWPDTRPIPYDTDYCFHRRATTADPSVQVALFIGLACRVLFGMGRDGCDLIMKFLIIFANTLLGLSPADKSDERIRRIPNTIDSVENHFNIAPRTTVYAVCPLCHCTYRPQESSNPIPLYPSICTHKQSYDSNACGTALLDDDGKPHKIFEYHHLEDYIAGLLSQLDKEKEMDLFCERILQAHAGPPATFMTQVSDGCFWRSFNGPDGRLFVDGGEEVRIALALNVDYFCAEGSTLRGASTSCGVISAACLNLPAEIRYDPANMYVAGIIPGTSEPSLDEESHYLRPVVDDMVKAYVRGVHYSRTASRPAGRTGRTALACLVLDFPAARRTTGHTTITSHHYCTVCRCEQCSTISRTDYENWRKRDPELIRQLAGIYAILPDSLKGQHIKRHGIRNSELWRLPYWNPVTQLTVDPMHTIFEVICQRYTREALQLHSNEKDGDEDEDGTNPTKVKTKKQRAFHYDFATPIDIPLLTPDHYPKDSVLHFLSKRPQAKWQLLVPDIHRILVEPVPKGDLPETRDALLKRLGRKLKDTLLYVCDSLDLKPENGQPLVKAQSAVLAACLVKWRFSMPLRKLGHAELDSEEALVRVRHVIATCVRPSSVSVVPLNFGDSKAGTIKADQWKILWRLYIPMAFMSLWGQGMPNRVRNADEMDAMLDNIMSLSAVATIASNRSLTLNQIESYREMLRKYVEGLKILFPGFLPPTIHMAFHLYDFMLLFGPCKSWWCFPYERIIGRLQNTPHNHKFGELESTMLHSFARNSKARQWLSRENAPSAIQRCKAAFQKTNANFRQRSGLDHFYVKDEADHLRLLLGTPSVQQASQIYRYGISYSTTSHHAGNSQVLIKSESCTLTPVRIDNIVLHDNQVLLVARKLLAAPSSAVDPFRSYPHFNASIYSSRYDSSVQVHNFDEVVGHFASYELGDDLSAIVLFLRE